MTGVLAIAAIVLASLVTGAILAMAFKVSDAKDDTKRAAVREAILDSQLTIAKSNITTEKDRADKEKARGDKLDNLIAKYAAQTVGGADPHGQFKLLLQEWALDDGSVVAGQVAVPDPRAAETPASRDLLKPGD